VGCFVLALVGYFLVVCFAHVFVWFGLALGFDFQGLANQVFISSYVSTFADHEHVSWGGAGRS